MSLTLNQSLTPTKLSGTNQPATPSHYPDKRSYVAAYKRMVQAMIETPEERAQLQKALKDFHDSFIVEDLMENIKDLLNSPKRRQLYHAIRPLIPSRLRQEYNSLIPHIPSFEKKVVNMKQVGSRSYGFVIRGGREFGCGIFVSSVLPSSRAAQHGLKPGDEIVRVNGLTLSGATHEEVVNLIKLKKTLLLTCKSVGMIPNQDPSGHVSWVTVVGDRKKHHTSSSRLAQHGPIVKCARRVQANMDSSNVLGASIKTSADANAGVFIVDIVPNSVAHNAGLKVGDEILDVNGRSLLNISHHDAVAMLKSSNSLMLTVRVEESFRRDQLHPFSNPPADFELKPHDFDIDAEMMPVDPNESTGFMLRAKEDPNAAGRALRAKEIERNKNIARLSLLDMEIEQSRGGAQMASPAAWGYGPALAMPTLMGMMPETDTQLQEGQESNLLWPTKRDSGQMPPSLVTVFQNPDGEEQPTHLPPSSPSHPSIPSFHPPPPPPPPPHGPPAVAPKPKNTPSPSEESKTLSTVDVPRLELASYQFPVDEEEEEKERQRAQRHPSLDRKPSASAMKKSPHSDGSLKGRKKTPAFRDRVEIINVPPEGSAGDSVPDSVHPSNMEFSEEVLQGRRVAFHTIPKEGPLKIAIRGGTDTPLGGQVIISRILEGGAADRYGKLNVGDQLLVCDGVGLLDVTHDEAAQALKRAMDMESSSIDLVVAVNPDFDNEPKQHIPDTVWPSSKEDTVCDEPPPGHKYDYARSSHRSHSGFTLRGKDPALANRAHAFLPTTGNPN